MSVARQKVAVTKVQSKKKERKYPQKDLKLLFGFSAGICAFPGCNEMCLRHNTGVDDAAVLAQIAHIEAHSDKGPRANSKLTAKQRDSYNNWILLCGTHHDLVDMQPNTFTVDDLRKWKKEHETYVHKRLIEEMPKLTFAELDVLANAIAGPNSHPTNEFTVITPNDKIQRNELSSRIADYIRMGMVQEGLVRAYISHVAIIDSDFPERLTNGFKREYKRLKTEYDSKGDQLFLDLLNFASPNGCDFTRMAAGLSILTHLFNICEVFEK